MATLGTCQERNVALDVWTLRCLGDVQVEVLVDS